MSSLRNAVERRPHKERSQPQNRQKWGILEKHKDYSLRAQDYNTKKRKLAVLSQKSRERHPDEFAFGMLSSGSATQGRHTGKNANENRLSHDAVKLMKTQDIGYLRTVAAQTRRELSRVDQQVGMDGAVGSRAGRTQNGGGKKVVFDEDVEALRRQAKPGDQDTDENVDSHIYDTAILSSVSGNVQQDVSDTEQKTATKPLSKKAQERQKDALSRLKLERRRRKRLQEARAAKLELLRKRQRDVQAAADELELQRARMAKVVGGTNKNGIKFKIRERKR